MSDVTKTMNSDAAKDAINEAMSTSGRTPLSTDSFLELVKVNDPYRLMKRFWGHWLRYASTPHLKIQGFRRMLMSDELQVPHDFVSEEERLALTNVQTADVNNFFVELENVVRTYDDYIKLYEGRKDEQRQYDHDSQLKSLNAEHDSQLVDAQLMHDKQLRMLRDELEERLAKANTQRDEAHAQRDELEESLAEANTQRDELEESLAEANTQRDELEESLDEANAQRNEARDRQLATAARSVPWAAVAGREERLVMMQMSDDYQHAAADPAYMRDCTLLFIRSQLGLLDTRMRKVCAFGGGTNRDAVVCYIIDTPNAKALFNAFKELAFDETVVVLRTYGGRLVGDNDNAAVIQLMEKANQQKFVGVFDGDDEDDDDDDDDDDQLAEANAQLDEANMHHEEAHAQRDELEESLAEANTQRDKAHAQHDDVLII